jgi:transposase InsO family protein
VLQVSRAAYYHWGHQPLSERAQADIQLTERIATIHTRSRQTYGAPRVRAELRNMGHGHSRKRVARLMRLAGLAGRYPKRFRRTTISDPLTSIPDLVQRDFAPSAPNQLWVGDITYIRTWEGWLYLAVLLDCYSRRVVGWSMADHLRTELPLSALQMALARRGPAPQLIHHTDRGSQYTSDAYTKVLDAHRVRSSLSRPHNCWDNAVAESFFATLKSDLVYRHPWPTRAAARTAIFEYIEGFYNPRRIHSTLGNLSPVDYETRNFPVAQSA